MTAQLLDFAPYARLAFQLGAGIATANSNIALRRMEDRDHASPNSILPVCGHEWSHLEVADSDRLHCFLHVHLVRACDGVGATGRHRGATIWRRGTARLLA